MIFRGLFELPAQGCQKVPTLRKQRLNPRLLFPTALETGFASRSRIAGQLFNPCVQGLFLPAQLIELPGTGINLLGEPTLQVSHDFILRDRGFGDDLSLLEAGLTPLEFSNEAVMQPGQGLFATLTRARIKFVSARSTDAGAKVFQGRTPLRP